MIEEEVNTVFVEGNLLTCEKQTTWDTLDSPYTSKEG